MAKTSFRGFSAKKQGFQGLNCKKPGLKHNYTYKQGGLYANSDEKGPW
jgi:hypothetical protein